MWCRVRVVCRQWRRRVTQRLLRRVSQRFHQVMEFPVAQSFEDEVQELLKTSKAADREDRERAEVLQALIKHPGWDVYAHLLQVFVQSRSNQVLGPAGSVNGAVALEYVKGTMN